MKNFSVVMLEKISRIMPRANQGGSGVGLDIGSFSVKAVKIERSNPYRISALGFKEIEGGNLTEAVREVLSKAGITDKKVNIGLSGKQVVTRSVLVPDMEESDFKNSLKYEAAKYIPFPVNEVILDSVVLKHRIENNKMLVLIAAAKKDFVEQRVKTILDLGLEPSVLDIDSLALVNSFNLFQQTNKPQPGIYAVLNLGSRLGSLVFLEDGLFKFSRDISFGGESITQKIGAKLGIDFIQAEKIKLSREMPEEVRAIIEAGLLDLVGELRLSFDYYESQTGKTVGCVYLSGGASCLKGIENIMGSAMNIVFEPWNPFGGLKLDDSLDKELTVSYARHFAVATGLSLR